MWGRNSLLRGRWGTGTGCPESCGCPIPGGAQGQVGWGPGQPELVGGSQPMAGVGTGWCLRSLPTQAILWSDDTGNRRKELIALGATLAMPMASYRPLIATPLLCPCQSLKYTENSSSGSSKSVYFSLFSLLARNPPGRPEGSKVLKKLIYFVFPFFYFSTFPSLQYVVSPCISRKPHLAEETLFLIHGPISDAAQQETS